MGKSAGDYNLNNISDEDVKRKIIKLKSQIGTNILEGTVYILGQVDTGHFFHTSLTQCLVF
jgi:hypothetical protein